MITVHHLDNSRSQRILWLLEELGLEYQIVFYKRQPIGLAPPELETVHPLGKAPVVDFDGKLVAESGAAVELIVQRYGRGRLMPDPASDDYLRYVELLHYPEGSMSAPLGMLLFSNVFRIDNAGYQSLRGESDRPAPRLRRETARRTRVRDRRSLTAADIQLTFTLQHARRSKVLDPAPSLAFVARMESRDAYKRAIERAGVHAQHPQVSFARANSANRRRRLRDRVRGADLEAPRPSRALAHSGGARSRPSRRLESRDRVRRRRHRQPDHRQFADRRAARPGTAGLPTLAVTRFARSTPGPELQGVTLSMQHTIERCLGIAEEAQVR